MTSDTRKRLIRVFSVLPCYLETYHDIPGLLYPVIIILILYSSIHLFLFVGIGNDDDLFYILEFI